MKKELLLITQNCNNLKKIGYIKGDYFCLKIDYVPDLIKKIKAFKGFFSSETFEWFINLSKIDSNEFKLFLDENNFEYNTEDFIKLRIIDFRKNKFIIDFGYDKDILEEIRKGPYYRNFNTSNRYWEYKYEQATISLLFILLNSYNFKITSEAQLKLELLFYKEEQLEIIAEINKAYNKNEGNLIEVKGLKKELKPFQKIGVDFIINNKKVLLGDEMGLGKTIQAIASIYHLKSFPCLIISPNSLKYNWEKEIIAWTNKKVRVINSSDIFEISKNEEFIIIGYSSILKFENKLIKLPLQSIVLDESHYLKNNTAKRTKIVKKLSKKIPIKILLSGTPIKNKPVELLPQLEILEQLENFGGWWKFVNTFCEAKRTRYGLETKGAQNLELLHDKMRSLFYLRREKSQVLKDLPEKQRQIIELDINNTREYKKAESNIISYLREANSSQDKINKAQNAEILVQINILKKLAIKGKLDSIKEWIEEFLEVENKLVVFAMHTEIINELSTHFRCNKITGEVDIKLRQQYVEDFQNNPDTHLLILNIIAGGVGLTLTSSSNIAIIELPWTPADLLQAEDRCHRIGQKNSVNCYYLLGKETIDKDIYNLLLDKMIITNAVNKGIFLTEDSSLLPKLISNLLKD